jgi:L,D-transpeptidase ErfK/SrfK
MAAVSVRSSCWRTLRLSLLLAAAGIATLQSTPALALTHVLPPEGEHVIGRVVAGRTAYEDTFASLAERYSLGYQKLVDANPEVDPWIPGDGTPITLPFKHILPNIERDGIVINLPEYRLYYFLPDGEFVVTFPIGIGREEFPTPIIDTRVVSRISNPSWTPPASARREYLAAGTVLPRVVPPGPDNPLGPLAIQLGVPGYFIHGTNRPFGVGQRASLGCIRLYNEEIAELVRLAPNGTRVRTISQPYKIGWRDGELYLEVHRPLDADVNPAAVASLIMRATDGKGLAVDWKQVELVTREARGVPTPILERSKRAATTAAR